MSTFDFRWHYIISLSKDDRIWSVPGILAKRLVNKFRLQITIRRGNTVGPYCPERLSSVPYIFNFGVFSLKIRVVESFTISICLKN